VLSNSATLMALRAQTVFTKDAHESFGTIVHTTMASLRPGLNKGGLELLRLLGG
jgi:hypothetical protein